VDKRRVTLKVGAKVRMHDDPMQDGLIKKDKKDKKAASFVVIGEPDIGVDRQGDTATIEIRGLDLNDPITDEVKPRNVTDIPPRRAAKIVDAWHLAAGGLPRGDTPDLCPGLWPFLPLHAICGTLGRNRRSSMESMNISLPDPLKQFVDGQISTGRYSSASEYVRELIRNDEKRKAEEQLEAKLLEGLSGAETALTQADWTAIRKEALAKVEARKKKR
jgi:antitoxin ParD1/3/4